MTWFSLNNNQEIDSPALLIYKDRVQNNIDLMIKIAGNPERLMPHVKTHKMAEIVEMQLKSGISKFKCATIAEAEMLVNAGVKWILLAYQLVSPKTERYIEMIKNNPEITFSSLVDNLDSAMALSNVFQQNNLKVNIFVDINCGMNRTGHEVNQELLTSCLQIQQQVAINFLGVHLYDGHIVGKDFEERKDLSDKAFDEVNKAIIEPLKISQKELIIIAGGSPTFTVHALRKDVYCSPGTCLLWDFGYGDKFADQPFQYAAILLTRVISKPKKGIITIDLGHKCVGAENTIDKRFRLLNLENYKLISQSEEHGVIEVESWENIEVGQVFYAVPFHVCPTVNLYEEASVIENGNLIATWQVVARKRKLTY